MQYTYGDDGLDPAMMEAANGRPINFERTLANERRRHPPPAYGSGAPLPSGPISPPHLPYISATSPLYLHHISLVSPPGAPLLSGAALREMLDAHLCSREFRALVRRALPDEPTKCA